MTTNKIPHYSSPEWVGAMLTMLYGGEQLELELD
jgi:hypothetical protein